MSKENNQNINNMGVKVGNDKISSKPPLQI